MQGRGPPRGGTAPAAVVVMVMTSRPTGGVDLQCLTTRHKSCTSGDRPLLGDDAVRCPQSLPRPGSPGSTVTEARHRRSVESAAPPQE